MSIKSDIKAEYDVKVSTRKSKADEIIAQALEILRQRHCAGSALNSPTACVDWLRLEIGTERDEKFLVVYLNNQHQVIGHEILFTGSVDGAAVYPRVVIRQALEHNAAAVIFAHNHPSGTVTPSRDDDAITDKLSKALKVCEIRVLDHLIVSSIDSYSYAEHGKI